jgi:F-type H+-transporting ATPase subunit b
MRSLVLSLALLSASPALAAGGGGEGHSGLPIYEIVNFALLLGVLVYFGRAPMREMFLTRRETIARDIDAASALLDQAEARNAEWQRKLADLDRELEDLRATARRRAQEERERILAEASEAAERIQRDAVASVEQELRRAQDALREEAASLATELAAGMLREQVGEGDRERLLDEFISRVAATGPAAGVDAGGGR